MTSSRCDYSYQRHIRFRGEGWYRGLSDVRYPHQFYYDSFYSLQIRLERFRYYKRLHSSLDGEWYGYHAYNVMPSRFARFFNYLARRS